MSGALIYLCGPLFYFNILQILSCNVQNSTLSLLAATKEIVVYTDKLCKKFGPRSGRQNVGPDLGPNCLTL